MKALVIGGNRFFGKRLVERLLAKQVEVTLLNRGNAGDPFGEQVRRIRLDRKELRRDHPALGRESWDIIYDQVCYDAREARAACETFRERAARYVFTSSQSVYDPGEAIPESRFDPRSYSFREIAERDANYAEAKRQAEAVFFRDAGFPVTAARFPIVLGIDDYTGRLKFHVERIARGTPFFVPNPNARISFIQSRDAAEFLGMLAEKAFDGPMNCCSAEPIRISVILGLIEAHVGKRALPAASEKDGEVSPFGIPSDWFMSTKTLGAYGFRPEPIARWLPRLIEELARAGL